VVGDSQINGGFQYNCISGSPCPSTGIASFKDPFANVPSPTPAGGCQTPVGNTYPAGTYCSGIRISGNGTYTFGPGLITVEGGMTVTGSPTLNGNGVLFYLTGPSYSGLSIRGTATVNLTAQTSGPQAGILFFQDRSLPVGSTGSSFDGTSGNNFSGAFYFPTTDLTFSGTPNVADAAILVGWQIEFNGNAQLSDTLLPSGVSPLSSALLVE
jgi:hypothetical protein